MPMGLGIQIGATTPPRALKPVVAEAEQLGYGEIWLAEDYFELGGIASAATALAATESIPIGLGVVAASVRHPAVTAMEFATLSGVYPGRFIAGLGHGSPEWVRQMGVHVASPMKLLREVTTAVRQLLEGREVSVGGDHFSFDRIRLAHVPDAPPPLYLGVHGPASLRLSGELAEGTQLGWFSSPGYVAWARKRVDEGRARVGRTDRHQLVALCLLSISEDDPDAARRQIGEWATPMLTGMTDSPQIKASPMRSELETWVARGRGQILPAEFLDEFMAVGDLDSSQSIVERLLDAGADRVILVPNPAGFRSTSTMVGQIRLAASLLESTETRQ